MDCPSLSDNCDDNSLLEAGIFLSAEGIFFIKIYFSRNQIHFFAGYNVRGEKPGKGVGECGMTEL